MEAPGPVASSTRYCANAARAAGRGEYMSQTTRRSFLLRSSVGAAAVGAAVAFDPATAAAATSTGSTELPAGAAERGPIVAYIDDVHSGDISVLVGDRSVVVHDPAFVAALAHAAARP